MKKASPIPFPVERSLAQLGRGISLARRRRRLSQQDLAERIGASVQTVRRMEAGHPGTALVNVVRAMQVFGDLDRFDRLFDTAEDSIGLMMMDEQLPLRIRRSRLTDESGAF